MPEDLRKENIAKCLPPEERPSGPAGWTEEEAQEACETRSEKELQRQVGEYLRQRDIFAITSGMHRSSSTPRGTPDFLFSVKGYNDQGIPVAVECKSATGTLSEEQQRVSEKMLADGWVYAVVRDLGELQRLLKHLELK